MATVRMTSSIRCASSDGSAPRDGHVIDGHGCWAGCCIGRQPGSLAPREHDSLIIPP